MLTLCSSVLVVAAIRVPIPAPHSSAETDLAIAGIFAVGIIAGIVTGKLLGIPGILSNAIAGAVGSWVGALTMILPITYLMYEYRLSLPWPVGLILFVPMLIIGAVAVVRLNNFLSFK